MDSIAFYISDHGFGHASRNIPIIRYILEVRNDIKIYIKTGIDQGNFIKESIKDLEFFINVYFDLRNTDLGLVLKKNSLDINKDLLKEKVKLYINSWNSRIKRERKFLIDRNISLVISDIVPWIFNATNKLNIKSILISNFTWVDIYKEYLENEICDKLKKCYELANYTFLYDFYINSMKEYTNNISEIGLHCRDFNLENIVDIKNRYKYPIVFVSVGRSVELKNIIDVSKLKYNFIVTEGINLKGDNVSYLAKETNNTQDYIMASDYIITKAGWGTIAECLIANKKIAVISRENIAEDRNTIYELINRNLSIKTDINNLNIEYIINLLEKFNPSYDKFNFRNNYDEVANKILNLLI